MRVTKAEINSKNLIFNIKNIRKTAPNSEILAVVKANAYGHGAKEISAILRIQGINYLGVAFADEAVALRKSGDNGNIVVMVPGTKSDADLFTEYDLETCAADIEVIKEYSKVAEKIDKKIKTHLFINTGMNRDGIKPENAEQFIEECKELKGIELKGIMTHFASSEYLDKSFASTQLDKFKTLINNLIEKGHRFQYIHAANSGAVANIPDAHFNMIRPGISLYGYMPDEKLDGNINLKPVLSLKSEVLSIKSLKPGETAGYSFKYFSDDHTDLAIIPIGYGDGLKYNLSGKASCLINGNYYRIVGSICMDECIVELGNHSNVKIGDEVVFIGEQNSKTINTYSLAKITDTIPYDITTSISMRVPRILV